MSNDITEKWYSLEKYARDYELVENRIKIINQLLGCKYVSNVSNPCKLTRDGGTCFVMFDGCELCSWRMYDADGVRCALASVDGMADCVWLLSRGGFVNKETNNGVARCSYAC